jgi:hypothetical protein
MHPKSVCRFLVVLALGLSLSACGTRVVVIRGGPPPMWVDRLPAKRGQLCAVGYSGPTFYQQDCLKNAAENARGHLAESISVTIRTITIDISDGTRGSFDKDVFVQGSESASEAVLQGSEVEAQWMDMQGARGAQNGCYAYVCIDPGKPIEKMVETLQQKKLPPKTVEKVRANAEAAFEELERLEEKKAIEEVPPTPVPAPAETTEEKTEESPPPAKEEAAPGEEEKPGQDPAPADTQDDPDATEGATPAVRTIELPQD